MSTGNPYRASQTEQPQTDPGEPIIAAEVPTPVWLRAMMVGGPFCAGVLFLLSLEYLRDGQRGWAVAGVSLAATMMFVAWRWTR